jgi:hypothetical protein
MFPKNSVSPVYRVLVEVAIANMSSVFSALKMKISLQRRFRSGRGCFSQLQLFQCGACDVCPDALDIDPLMVAATAAHSLQFGLIHCLVQTWSDLSADTVRGHYPPPVPRELPSGMALYRAPAPGTALARANLTTAGRQLSVAYRDSATCGEPAGYVRRPIKSSQRIVRTMTGIRVGKQGDVLTLFA